MPIEPAQLEFISRLTKEYGTICEVQRPLAVPYIVSRRVCQFDIRFLIMNGESRIWYDGNPVIPHDCAFISHFKMIPPKSVVLDLGCNSGFNSVVYGKWFDVKVVGVDPFPLHAEVTKFNCDLNGIENVTYNLGVGLPGKIKVASSSQTAVHDENGDAYAELVPLDYFVKYNPSFIKIDIEGAEVDALRTGKEMFSSIRPNMYLEFHADHIKAFGYNTDDFIDALPDGYIMYASLPNAPLARYNKDMPITGAAAFYFFKEEHESREFFPFTG